MTRELIKQVQDGNDNATLIIIEKFNPILRRYAYKLTFEDSYNELLVCFIEFINKINISKLEDLDEESLTAYIYKSIKNYYIKLSIKYNQRSRIITYSELNDKELYFIDCVTAVYDSYFDYELPNIDCVLTHSELTIVNEIFLYHYSVKQIATMLSISRQAVNQAKRRALNKLHKYYLLNFPSKYF